jgi:hypothetical protein
MRGSVGIIVDNEKQADEGADIMTLFEHQCIDDVVVCIVPEWMRLEGFVLLIDSPTVYEADVRGRVQLRTVSNTLKCRQVMSQKYPPNFTPWHDVNIPLLPS